MDQFDRFACCKCCCVLGECADADDLDTGSVVVCEQPPHFAHHRYADLTIAPLLALNQFGASAAPENQIDATIRAALACLFDSIALPSEGFADQLFELLPAQCAQIIQIALRRQESLPCHSAPE